MANGQKKRDHQVSSGARKDAKARRAEENEQRRLENLARKQNGEPTPWEIKRAARKAARADKQKAYQEAQDRKHEANRQRDAREQRAKDALAAELLREQTKGKRRQVANASK